ncbi:hypothetical protein PPSQR21_032340 [Paenibacillus polymyxa SQR-21]|uniref:FRG domain-containing protein n=1 Tax=Paenibacillus polymyxa TaxID=1406 RepID=UPI00042E2728|nr:FRG domain-containing protein [Paenibacillus polymyxa]AHM66873.1 hypothetical protein PPSQR21_032340 [Paenibacillus polymyxa SQR-21]
MAYSSEWFNILNTVDNFCKGIHRVWFRGHSDSEFQLKSGLFRIADKTLDYYLNFELLAYRQFLNLGHLHHSEKDWNLLYLMQHHGVRTRLLDWSESFTTALYFARLSWNGEGDACVWMLDPSALNKLTLGAPQYVMPYEGVSYEDYLFNKNEAEFHNNSIALYATRNDSRMVNQQGVFTLQGNSMLSLDQEHDEILKNEGKLVKVILPLSTIDDIDNYLLQAGVTDYTMFPDLDGLARQINSLRGYSPRISMKLNFQNEQ